MNKKILVTGGLGYIGSHTVVELLSKGYEVVVVDNLSNSKLSVIDRVEYISGKTFTFYEIDLLYEKSLSEVFDKHDFDSVIHFAGLKAVGESVSNPLMYYHVNIQSSLNLLKVMQEHRVYNIVLSSSATVYGMNNTVPFVESMALSATNPYGSTKIMLENILHDLQISDNKFNITCLRYFNPVGSHKSGMIGEDPQGIPNNLMPYISKVGSGRLSCLRIFGGDYDTPDGTGVRDYIHVVDLAHGHILALNELENSSPKWRAYNLGSGLGYSVLELVSAYSKSSGADIPYEIVGRRAGDIATGYADASKAEVELGFKTTKTINDICSDAIRWQNYARENDI